ncbi:hypothetical protein V9T40_014458 [Parthenolecanium corni]|uniref:Uncharacterized protein n=1 Tax=Parthenolecanium corni TaxID=536013 RepID=A0AAN9T5W7_9HEMI
MWTVLENASQKFKHLLSNINFIVDVTIVLVANLWCWCGDKNLCFRNANKRSRPIFNVLLASFLWCVLLGPCDGSRRKINFTLLAPEVPPEDEERLREILPTVRIGLEFVSNPKTGRLPSHIYDLGLHYRDTNGSATIGPLAAFDLKDQTGMFS